ncbi:MAG: hypothetical protein ACYC35_06590 [Pirellulales bacterium]
MSDSPSSSASGFAFFARSVWMVLGPMALAATISVIVTSGAGWLTPADAAYFVILAAMLAGRWIEFQGGSAKDSYGKPTTREHVRSYLIKAPAIGIAIWVLANVVGNYLLPMLP